MFARIRWGNNLIDHRLPTDWKDLQEKVAEIFRDIGYKTETEKDIETTREKVRVDVFSVDESQSPHIIYLCQCKHWETRVPKTVVHAFRTVVQDYGANFGLIISKKGFQKGAYEAARNTNIRLVDWFAFQDMFGEKWLPAISQKICDEFNTFINYTDALVPSSLWPKLDKFSKNRISRFKKIRRKYMQIGFAIVHLRYGQLYENLYRKLEFPIKFEVFSEHGKSKIIKLHSLRDYVDFLTAWAKKGMEEFDELLNVDMRA